MRDARDNCLSVYFQQFGGLLNYATGLKLSLTYTPMGYHMWAMNSLFHSLRPKLQWVFLLAALAWVVAPAQLTAAHSATGPVVSSHAPMAAAGAPAAQHDHSMSGCLGSTMQGSCALSGMSACAASGMSGCAGGAGAFLNTDQVLATDLADSPCMIFSRSALAALALASDPPPPRL